MPHLSIESGNPLSKKAFELAYAFFRLSEASLDRSFSEYFKSFGLQILHSLTAEDFRTARQVLGQASYFVSLAYETQAVSSTDKDVLVAEIKGLLEAVRIVSSTPKLEKNHLEGVFKEAIYLEKLSQEAKPFSPMAKAREERKSILVSLADTQKDTFSSTGGVDFGPRARQEAILSVIRQLNNCRLSDIQAVLPNISERTIRYDIQALIESGLIERIGNSGPATFYRIPKKDILPVSP